MISERLGATWLGGLARAAGRAEFMSCCSFSLMWFCFLWGKNNLWFCFEGLLTHRDPSSLFPPTPEQVCAIPSLKTPLALKNLLYLQPQ